MNLGKQSVSNVGETSGSGRIALAYDFEGVSNDADSHELLAVVAAIHHERVGEALNDWALCLAESLDGITAC